jgi:Flp pilus assembly protein TadD
MKIDWKSERTDALAGFCLAIEIAVLMVYAQTLGYQFVTYDDPEYVFKNASVTGGLTFAGLRNAFTSFYAANWHPVTWLSHMLDCQLFGLNAGAHHGVNLLLHMTTTALLFLAFTRMTGKPWRSAFVAGIFALHPLHVESVAWISERKDVLSGFFASLTLLAYARYAEAPSRPRYAAVTGALALGLMSKPMLVTLPFVLLLLDIWPLKRIPLPAGQLPSWKDIRRPVLEKLPLLGLSAVSAVLTTMAQRAGGSMLSLDALPVKTRIANAFVSYAAYLEKTLWPADLAILYPYQDPPPAGKVLLGAAVVLSLTLLAFAAARRRPYLLVGWLWYLGMLVPVSGIAQAGIQALADRFMYLPMVGLSLAVVWGIADIAENSGKIARCAAALGGLALLVCAAVSFRQAEVWQNSATLYRHALAVTQGQGSAIIHNNLGVVLENNGRRDEAITQFRRASILMPRYAKAHANLGTVLARAGRLDEAIAALNTAVSLRPEGDAESQNSLCAAYFRLQRAREAEGHCREALRLRPNFPLARSNLAAVQAAEGKNAEAAAEIARVMTDDPDAVHLDFARAFGWFRQAAEHGSPEAQEQLSLMYQRGEGVRQDYAQAYFWMYLCAGNSPASRQRAALDTDAEHLSTAQKTALEKRAHAWKPADHRQADSH